MKELKPCPFCRCEQFSIVDANDFPLDYEYRGSAIFCDNCPAGVESDIKTIDELFDAWNTRV